MVRTDESPMSSVPTTADRLPPSAAGSPLAVIFFAGMAEIVGARRLEMPWEGGTVADLRRELEAGRPALGPLLARSAVCVAGRYAADNVTIAVGAEVALIPPVS